MEDISKLISTLSLKDEKKVKSMNLREFSVVSSLPGEFKLFLPLEIVEFISETNVKNMEDFVVTEKLKSTLFAEKGEGEGQLKIDITGNPHVENKMILRALFAMLGSINEKNDFTQFTTDDYFSDVSSEHYIENFLDKNYRDYIDSNLSLIFGKFKLKDLDPLIKALKFIGINLDNEENNQESKSKNSQTKIFNPIYTNIKTFVLSKNKILVLITPTNNFWVKSEKLNIGDHTYDKKINTYSNIFLNWEFIQKFYDRIANHPRCVVGFLNSMLRKNLVPCIEVIPVRVKNFTKFVCFDQDVHENINPNTKGNAKPNFVRSLDKILSKAKKIEEVEVNDTNLIILESEEDKVTDSTKFNTIPMNVFSENNLACSGKEKAELNKKVDGLLTYLEKLLSDCEIDVREYISKNPVV